MTDKRRSKIKKSAMFAANRRIYSLIYAERLFKIYLIVQSQELERVTKTVFYALALYDIIYSIITRQNQIDNPLYFK